jgi:hypothetical protein
MQPLERGRALEVDEKTSWVSFKYEKLPQFCFSCGCLVHGEKGCSIPKPTRLSSKEGPKPWGMWLRAKDPGRKLSGGWSQWQGEASRRYKEESGGQEGDGTQYDYASWKGSSENLENPSSRHARGSSDISERNNPFPKSGRVVITRKGKGQSRETEGDYFQIKGGTNIVGAGKEPIMDSDDVWSTSLKLIDS